MSEFELEITDLARAGAGVGRGPDGRVVFVPFTAPGDRVRVRIVEQDRRYSQGELIEVLRASPQRVHPRCPVFGVCGGCSWQHLPYSLQWSTKVSGVAHALKRIGVAPQDLPPLQEIPALQIWEYRNRIQLRGFHDALGFFSKKSNDLVPIERCDIARSEINAALPAIKNHGSQLPKPYKVEVTISEGGQILESWNSPHASTGFRQIHDEQNERLRQWIAAHLSPGRWVLDLFGGNGNLTWSLRDRQTAIDCVDTSSPSTQPEEGHYRFHRSSVLPWLMREARSPSRPREGRGSAILDPPREGLDRDAQEVAAALESMKVDEVIAVGCDVDSWARDVSRFLKRGWGFKAVAVLDLFPQTPHTESLAVLSRRHFT